MAKPLLSVTPYSTGDHQNSRDPSWRVQNYGPYKVLGQRWVYFNKPVLELSSIIMALLGTGLMLLLWPSPKVKTFFTPSKAWAYYRRAYHMLAGDKVIVDHYSVRFPDDLSALSTIPSIGTYPAKTLAAIALNQPVIALNTNARRVSNRVFVTLGQDDRSSKYNKDWHAIGRAC